jgi:hypothetical protein
VRADPSEGQIGRKGLSNHRWIIGAKLAYLVNQYGLIVAWDYAATNAVDNTFGELIADKMVVLTDSAFHRKEGDSLNQKVCKRGTWNGRMVVETILSLLTNVCRLKKASQRTWAGLHARRPYTMAVFNTFVLWNRVSVNEHGTIHLSIAEFAL